MMISPQGRQPKRSAERLAGYATENPVSARVIDFVEENYARQISLRDVASTIGYSPGHLTTLFRRTTGVPVTAWIVRRRIVAAQDALAAGGTTVAMACEMAGFLDLCYFTRQFVRHVGVTPGRFRAQIGAQPSSVAAHDPRR